MSKHRDRNGRTRAYHRLPIWARDEIDDLRQRVVNLERQLEDAYDGQGARVTAADEEE